MKLPTTKQLRYFVALAEIGHFGRAAEACFVSQSAFSNAIRELETLLDVQLVDRTNRSVTITAMAAIDMAQCYGRIVVDFVRTVEDRLSKLEHPQPWPVGFHV